MFVRHADTQAINHLRKEQGLVNNRNWRDIYNLADPGMYGVIDMLEKNQLPLPEVGFEIFNKQREIVSELELAWPLKKVGVAVNKESAIVASREGWKVFSMRHALSRFDDLTNRVR